MVLEIRNHENINFHVKTIFFIRNEDTQGQAGHPNDGKSMKIRSDHCVPKEKRMENPILASKSYKKTKTEPKTTPNLIFDVFCFWGGGGFFVALSPQ